MVAFISSGSFIEFLSKLHDKVDYTGVLVSIPMGVSQHAPGASHL